MSFTSELLPEPETPVTQTNAPSGISTSMFFRLLCRAPMIQPEGVEGSLGAALGVRSPSDPTSTRRRHFDLQLAGQILSGHALLRLGDLLGRSLGDHLAAAHAGAGAEVDDRVGRPHRVFVVLDDDDRVAHVAQLRERVEQPFVVARVQADRRLVEDVEHAHQPQPICPARRIRCDSPPESVGAVRSSVRYSSPTLTRNPSRPRISLSTSAAIVWPVASSFELAEELGRVADRQRADFRQRALGLIGEFRMGRGERDRSRLRIEPCPSQAPQRMTLMYFSSCRRCIRLFELR